MQVIRTSRSSSLIMSRRRRGTATPRRRSARLGRAAALIMSRRQRCICYGDAIGIGGQPHRRMTTTTTHTTTTHTTLTHLECSAFGRIADAGRLQTTCPACGKVLYARYDLEAARRLLPREALKDREPTMWRYREVLPVRDA